jgi:hypothetical protein
LGVESVGDFTLPVTQPVTHDSEPPASKVADELPSALSANAAAVSSQPSLELPHPELRFGNLYVDRLLEDKRVPTRLEGESSIIKVWSLESKWMIEHLSLTIISRLMHSTVRLHI